MELQWQWQFEPEGGSHCSLREPASYDGSVLVAAGFAADGVHASALISLDANAGEVRWQHTAQGVPHKPVCDDDGRAYLGTFDGRIDAFDRNGRRRWSYQNGAPLGGPVVTDAGDVVVADVAGWNAATLCLAGDSGSLRWRNINGGHSYPLASDGNVVVHSTARRNESGVILRCLKVDSGEWSWSARSQTCLFRPCIIDPLVFVSAVGGIQAHDLATGEREAFLAAGKESGV